MGVDSNVLETLADAVLNRPREFFIGEERFCLWSPSLGMSILIGRRIEELDIDVSSFALNTPKEALRLVKEKRKEVCHIIALHTFNRYEDFCESKRLDERTEFFSKALDEKEITELFLVVLSTPKAETIILSTDIHNDQEKQAKIAQIKNKDGNTFTFGGKTVYGTLLDAACKNYGWTKEYVVWGIDLVSLRLMMADSINSVYLTDEEKKKVSFSASNERIDMHDKEAMARLMAMDWK